MSSRLWLGVAAVAVAALVFGSVQTTGALWKDSATASAGTVTAGTLSLSTGGGAGPTNYTFADLAQTNALPGDFVQKPLTIVNTSKSRRGLSYRLTSAGPTVSAGPGVTVNLSGTVVASAAACGATGTPVGTAAFTPFSSSSAATVATGSPRDLLENGSEIWCIRSTLASSSPTAQSTYTLAFSFGVVAK